MQFAQEVLVARPEEVIQDNGQEFLLGLGGG